MKSLYSFLSRVESTSNVKLSESTATNQTKNSLKKFILRTAGVVALLLFLGNQANGQTYLATESFDGATFVPTGWTDFLTSGTNTWTRVTAGTTPTCATQSGAGMAKFNSYDSPGTGVRSLISPVMNFSTAGTKRISFWMYRDNGYNTTADRIEVLTNTAANTTGATLLGTVNRARGLAPTVAANGWYNYTFDVTTTSATTYLILRATGAYGNNIFIDNVGVAAPVVGYCTPTGTSGYYISNVTTTAGATNIANATAANAGYGNFTAQSASNSIGTGTGFSVAHSATAGGAGVGVWIDWNNDLDFADVNEQIGITTGWNYSPFTGTINIPVGTSTGNKRMRIVIDYNAISPISCPVAITGETEDYTFTVAAGTPCSGTPSPGNTVASSASVATGSTVNLSLSTPPTGSGLTYQWQSGPTNTGAWTNVGTSASTYVPTVSATTWYRCIVTCSGVTGTSAPVQVTAVVANNIPFSGSSSVACGTSTLIYDHAGASTDYSIFANGYIVLNNNLGSTSVISLTGTYATESGYDYLRIYNGTGTAGTLIASYSGSGTITPFTSSAGQTITVQFTSDVSGNAAGISLNAVYSGSCVVPVCSGTPTPGNTISSPSFVAAPSGNVNLSLQNATVGTGVTYQWQSSTSQTGTYTNIVGATSSTYTATVSSVTWFRCVVTCAGNSGTSSPVQVTLSACIPTMTYGCTDGDVIARVILNTLDNNSGTGCPSGTLGYSNYTTNAALTTTLQPSTSYNCIVYAGQYAANYAAWIDYNDNFVFEASERIGYTLSTVAGSGFVGVLGSSASFPVTLACTPPAGQHLLRIREVYNQTSGVTITPCGNNEGIGFGEIEDYMITIAPAPACPSPGLVSSITASSNSVALTWATSCSSASSYDFEYGPVGFTLGSGTLVSNQTVTISAPNASYTVTGLQAGTNYDIYYRANCGSSTSAWSLTSNFSTPNSVSAASSTPTLCQGTVMTSITHNTQGATGIGTATGLPSGVTAAWSSNIITISGIPTVSGVFGYSIPLTGGFGSLNATGTITVLAAPIAPTATSPQVFCETANATIASLQVSGAAGSTFAWYTASTGGVALSSSTALSIGTTNYFVGSIGTNGCVSLTRTSVSVTENPLLSASVSITGTTACPGGVLLFTSTPVNGGTNPTFQWYNGGIAISGANQSTYSATGLAPGDVINVKMVPSGSCVTVCQ